MELNLSLNLYSFIFDIGASGSDEALRRAHCQARDRPRRLRRRSIISAFLCWIHININCLSCLISIIPSSSKSHHCKVSFFSNLISFPPNDAIHRFQHKYKFFIIIRDLLFRFVRSGPLFARVAPFPSRRSRRTFRRGFTSSSSSPI